MVGPPNNCGVHSARVVSTLGGPIAAEWTILLLFSLSMVGVLPYSIIECGVCAPISGMHSTDLRRTCIVSYLGYPRLAVIPHSGCTLESGDPCFGAAPSKAPVRGGRRPRLHCPCLVLARPDVSLTHTDKDPPMPPQSNECTLPCGTRNHEFAVQMPPARGPPERVGALRGMSLAGQSL